MDAVRGEAAAGGTEWAWRLAMADRACCCTARPVVVVVLPPTADRPHPTDLLLCGHHFHAARPALVAAGARVYGADGPLIGDAEEHGDPVQVG